MEKSWSMSSFKQFSSCLGFFFLFVCFFAVPSYADIVINEVMSSNSTTIQDPRGDYSDWIEIHNTGPSSVNLADYIISDVTHYWYFPNITMPAGEYLILWANDNNRQSTFELNFKLSASGETVQLGTSQQLLDEVVVPMLATDESYGRYPNGTGAFERMSNPTPDDANQQNTEPNNPDAQYIKINEVALSNVSGLLDEDGDTSDWIELYNDGSPQPVELQGLRLGDSSKQWIFPDVDLADGEFLIIFASDKNRTDPASELHTNFKLSATGEMLYFYNKDGTTVEDSVDLPAIPQDHSYCRIPDGSGDFEDTTLPTPGEVNQHVTIEPNPDAQYIKINEVVAKNESGLRDFENDYEDWIELYNAGSVAVDLKGLRLVDSCDGSGCNPSNPTSGGRVWAFPSTLWLQPGEFLVVFASGKNELTGELHTNFDISAAYGEEIFLANTNGYIENFLDVPFIDDDGDGAADADVSWGRDPDGDFNARKFDVPTPGAPNTDVVIINNPDGEYVAINEVCSDNSSVLADQFGDYPDWIELYNTHSQPINLEGLKLQDYSLDPQNPSTTTWVFPDIEMGVGEFLVVFASDKNIIDPSELHTNFKLSAGGEGLRILNKDNSEETSVEVASLLPNESYGRNPDGTGSFEVYTVPTPGQTNNQVVIPPNPDAWMITINEVAADNRTGLQDEDGAYSDWIELYNKGNKNVDLENLKLQDSGDVWSFPSVVMAPGSYLVVFASGKNRHGAQLHTNFQINTDGETLKLLNTNSADVEIFQLPEQFPDQSYGRLPDGDANLQVFENPSPGASNSGIPGDLNSDSAVNYSDFMILLNQWGRTDMPVADIDRDGNVGYSDFMVLLSNWTG